MDWSEFDNLPPMSEEFHVKNMKAIKLKIMWHRERMEAHLETAKSASSDLPKLEETIADINRLISLSAEFLKEIDRFLGMKPMPVEEWTPILIAYAKNCVEVNERIQAIGAYLGGL